MNDKNVLPGRQAVLVFVDELPSGTSAVSLLEVLLRYWKLIAVIALCAAVISITYCKLSPKWYRAQALIAPVRQDAGGSALGGMGGEIGGLASLVGIDIGDGEEQKKESMARFTSREFIYEFLRAEGIIPVLFAEQWDAKGKRWKSAEKTPSMDDAYRYFTERIVTIAEDRRTNLIKVTVDWTDQPQAAAWANSLVARINADRRAVARAESDRNLEFLNRELERTGIVDLRQAINRLVETEIRKRMLVNVREQYAFKIIDPAVVPGPHSVVRPRIAFLTAIALVLGTMLGCAIALLHHYRRASRRTG
jgi:uncharacterized protein involved in exopolysaccharide biosynthesis